MVVTMAVAMSGNAWAGDDAASQKCKVATLKGSYVFTATGFNIVAGVPVPKAIVELIDFHGDGTLSVPGGILSVNGVVTQIAPNGFGTYNFEANCTGTIVFTPGPSFTLVFDPDAKTGWMIQTNANTVFQGTVTLLHR
jgi:hypothetical protein